MPRKRTSSRNGFIHADAHDLAEINETFDIITLSDLVNDLCDVQRVFDQVRRLCSPDTRLIIDVFSHLWEILPAAAQKLNLATPNLDQNWLTRDDLRVMFRLAGFEAVRISQEVPWPLPFGGFANRFLVRLWPFREMASHPSTPSLLLRQTGIGKADAVRLGFSKANGDVLMILDADITVSPEDLPRLHEALISGKGEFINSVRLIYPMKKEAMRALNLFGNKFFSAAKLNLKIIDMPVRYRERTYGSTKISRWKHGLLLFHMVAFAARRMQFV